MSHDRQVAGQRERLLVQEPLAVAHVDHSPIVTGGDVDGEQDGAILGAVRLERLLLDAVDVGDVEDEGGATGPLEGEGSCTS
jgi:hypothetical protein